MLLSHTQKLQSEHNCSVLRFKCKNYINKKWMANLWHNTSTVFWGKLIVYFTNWKPCLFSWIHVQLMASDSFVAYNISAKWNMICLVNVLSRTVGDSDWRFVNRVIIIFMVTVKTSVPLNSPNKKYAHDHLLSQMNPRLKPFRKIIKLLYCVRKYSYSSVMVF